MEKFLAGLGILVGILAGAVLALTKRKEKRERPEYGERQNQGRSEGKNRKESAENLRKAQEELLAWKRRAEEVKRCRAYGRLFGEIVRPVQYMAGLAALWPEQDKTPAEKWASPEFMWKMMERDVYEKIDFAIQDYKAKLEEELLKLPQKEKEEMTPVDTRNSEEIERLIGQYRAEAESEFLEIWKKEKTLIEEFGKIWEKICALARGGTYRAPEVCEAVKETAELFEKYGFYFMFFEDERLDGCSEAKRWFVRVSEKMLVYPALLIKKDGRYEQYGSFLGTRRADKD